MRGPARPRRPRQATPRVLALAVVVLLGAAAGCVSGRPALPTVADEPLRIVRHDAPQVSPEERARVRELAVEALEALAGAQREAIRDEASPKVEARLRTAHQRVEEAQRLRPPAASQLALPGGSSVQVRVPREPLRIPLGSFDAATLARLRPLRPPEAEVLRVDLDALERRLARALAGSPERARTEIFLASSTALALEPAPHASATTHVSGAPEGAESAADSLPSPGTGRPPPPDR